MGSKGMREELRRVRRRGAGSCKGLQRRATGTGPMRNSWASQTGSESQEKPLNREVGLDKNMFSQTAMPTPEQKFSK